MAKIMFSNLARINDYESKFFLSLFSDFENHGNEVKFWSTIQRPEMKKYILPMDFRIGNWVKHYPASIFSGAINWPDLDWDKWRLRIKMLPIQDVPGFSVEDLLEIILRVTLYNLNRYKPDAFFSWNTFCPHTGIAAEITKAEGIDTYLIERGFLPDTYFMEKGGLLGSSIITGIGLNDLIGKNEFKDLLKAGKQYLKESPFFKFLRYEQKNTGGIHQKLFSGEWSSAHPRVVFFPPDDLTLGMYPTDGEDRKRHLPLYEKSLKAAEELARANRSGITLFKPHPSSTGAYFDDFDEGSGLKIVDHNFVELVEWADVIATTGSGLSFVALSERKPVMHFGRDQLYGKQIVYEVNQKNEIEDVLNQAYKKDAFERRYDNYLAFLGFSLKYYLVNHPESHSEYRKTKDVAREWMAGSSIPHLSCKNGR